MAKKQKSYIVSREADAVLALMADADNRSKGSVIEVLVKEAGVKKGFRLNFGVMVDPEKDYPVSYQINQKGERTPPPASGVMKGRYLTEPQIRQLYNDELI